MMRSRRAANSLQRPTEAPAGKLVELRTTEEYQACRRETHYMPRWKPDHVLKELAVVELESALDLLGQTEVRATVSMCEAGELDVSDTAGGRVYAKIRAYAAAVTRTGWVVVAGHSEVFRRDIMFNGAPVSYGAYDETFVEGAPVEVTWSPWEVLAETSWTQTTHVSACSLTLGEEIRLDRGTGQPNLTVDATFAAALTATPGR